MKIASAATGFLASLAGLVACLFVYAQYSDYREKAELENLLFSAQSLQRQLEDSFRKTGRFDDSVTAGESFKAQKVSVRNGTISVTGSLGQLLVLVPNVDGDMARWQCYAAPERAIPRNCHAD